MQDASLNLELRQNLDLFLDGSIEDIAPIMCQCLEDKFINDMDLDNPMQSAQEIINQIEEFVRAEIKGRTHHRNEVFYS